MGSGHRQIGALDCDRRTDCPNSHTWGKGATAFADAMADRISSAVAPACVHELKSLCSFGVTTFRTSRPAYVHTSFNQISLATLPLAWGRSFWGRAYTTLCGPQ